MSGLVIAYAHWKTNAVGSRYPPCTCRFSNGTTLCQHSGAAHLFRLFFSHFCKISQISCEFVHFVLISPLQTAEALMAGKMQVYFLPLDGKAKKV